MSETADNAAAPPSDDGDTTGDLFPPAHVGERLAAARHRHGLTLQDIASRTRIPMRHLEAMEAGKFETLPGRTYAIGFGKAYARAVELPEDDIAQQIREALGGASAASTREVTQFDLDEPSKVPSARLALLAAVTGAVILLAGFGVWRSYLFPAANVEELAQAADAASASEAAPRKTDAGAKVATAPAIDPGAEVVFTATEDNIWIKFYDGEGKQLMQKQMALGEQYVVPADAVDPQVWTGRPDAFEITVGGRTVAPLGTAEVAVKDVPVTAAALMARPAASPETASQADDSARISG
ncbi:cytoskeletal protein RodZ [Blastomonas natatoria]|uniref:Cytoskeletal protein RodZ n=1 Tax=Blastomonas natatoria TaxID=34015 RepID=A0A2V3V2P3_9SPHN|nr:RodZ domain-containing protein [Blastomonas natatoria]PXW76056.1 cytoskeletal protein RodZ [Blastomonas natatoria]